MSEPRLVLIGTAITPYERTRDCPRQPWTSTARGTLAIDAEYLDAVHGLTAGMKAHVLWWAMHADRTLTRRCVEAGGPLLGVMASRGVARPNPIGLTLVEVVEIDGARVHVRGLDCVSGSPLLDIKPAIDVPLYQ